MPFLLNLASGTDLREPPWINLDVVAKWPGAPRGCDIVWDARKDLLPFDDNSADGVYAGYLFLHLAPRYHNRVMREIYRVIKPHAELMVGEVAMDRVIQRWLDNPDDEQATELIWGEQGSVFGANLEDFDKHCCGWTRKKLSDFLTSHGMTVAGEKRVHGDNVWYELSLSAYKEPA